MILLGGQLLANRAQYRVAGPGRDASQ